MLEEVAGDGHRVAVVLLGGLAGPAEGVAQPLAAAPCQLPVAAHLGKGAIEVQVGQVEEPVRHRVANVSSRLTLSGAGAAVNLRGAPAGCPGWGRGSWDQARNPGGRSGLAWPSASLTPAASRSVP